MSKLSAALLVTAVANLLLAAYNQNFSAVTGWLVVVLQVSSSLLKPARP